MYTSWDEIGISIFSKMTEEANKAGAVNLAQGFPDFEAPRELLDGAISAINNGYNQYSPSAGYRELRQAICDYVQKNKALTYSPDNEVCVFSGATEALYCAVMALCKKGDEVLAFEPFFDIYPGFALAAGAEFKTVLLRPKLWDFDIDELRQAINKNTKVLILNSPHNPSGKIFSKAELQAIAELAIEKDIHVITDEVYEEIYFDENLPLSIAQVDRMKERTVRISSAAKTFSITGWKIGYALGNKKILQRMRTIHEHLVFCSASPLEKAVVKAYQFPDSYFIQLRKDYEEKKTYLLESLQKTGFDAYTPQGTFFIVADYSQISQAKDLDFSLWLTQEIKVSCIPLSIFYKNKNTPQQLVRFCFAKSMQTLMKSKQNFEKTKNLIK